MTVEQLRKEALNYDHDCKVSQDDGCSDCQLIYEGDKNTLIDILLKLNNGGLI
jgi:hypothetical protein